MKIPTHVTICIALVAFHGTLAAETTVKKDASSVCRIDGSGKLVYRKDAKGNRLPDFSHVGYHAGEKALPDVPVRMTIEPAVGDDTMRIQDALDKLGTLRLDKNGHRGALLLKRGAYRIEGVLRITHTGIVLRGEGSGPDGTLIIAAGYDDEKYKRTLITVGNRNPIVIEQSSRQEIITDYVPIGVHSFEIESAKDYEVGDRIVVYRPSTKEWIASIGCDRIRSKWMKVWNTEWRKDGPSPGFFYQRDGLSGRTFIAKRKDESWEAFQKRIPLSENGKKLDTTSQWQPGSYDFYFERTITAITGTTVTIDAPVVHVMEKAFGGGAIFKYTTNDRISEVGIENLRLVSEFAKPEEGHPFGSPKRTRSSELHGWNGIVIDRNVENTWVRNVTGNYFGWSLVSAKGLRSTITDCVNLGHASKIAGGRRYPFMINGQLNLVQRCVTFEGRHEFVNQARTAGPNVFVDCVGYNSKSLAGPHHRYAIGNLYDNITSEMPMESRNRGSSGTGHGWAGTQTCFYNCVAPGFNVQAPPGGISWVLGCGKSNEEGGRVSPPSLYYQQVQDRLGIPALERLATEEQLENMGKYLWVRKRVEHEEALE